MAELQMREKHKDKQGFHSRRIMEEIQFLRELLEICDKVLAH